ncbi:MAG: hypothetical protein ABEK42_13995, partial [Thiohalorhabdaceae bacterium]
MARPGRILALLATLLLVPTQAAWAGTPHSRTFDLTYTATIQPGDTGGPVDIFLPVARDTPHQDILEVQVESPVDGELGREPEYGNRFWHARLEELPDAPLTIRAHYRVQRDRVSPDLSAQANAGFDAATCREHARFLEANRRVPVDGELIREVLADVPIQDSDPPQVEARKIYDYVIDTMAYKKVGS